MKVIILMGSPRINGNTAELCKPFIDELRTADAEVEYITLSDKQIGPCKACYACQQVSGVYGCPQSDDMQGIVDGIVTADVVVLATPIFTWYCPPKMKAMLDRHYGMNKFYGAGNGSLWEGKGIAIIVTHGYDRAYGTQPFETGIRCLCEHSHLRYLGMYSVRDEDDLASFKTPEAIEGARAFAREILQSGVTS